MIKIDPFVDRLIRHPAWLIMLPMMRVMRRRVSNHDRMLQECLNVIAPPDREAVRKLLSIISKCVICGDDMNPLSEESDNENMMLRFTCLKEECVTDDELDAALNKMEQALIGTHFPDQTSVF